MKKKTRTKDGPRLRLIQGGRRSEMWLGSVQIVAAPKDEPPFTVSAMAAEEDTFLVLSANPEVRDPKEHPVRLMTRVIETRPETPGSVVVKGGSPLRLLAVVHDLNQVPSWKEEWVVSALDGILQEADRQKLQSIALPMLATRHGSLKEERFIELLQDALERVTPIHLKRLWLIIPAGMSNQV